MTITSNLQPVDLSESTLLSKRERLMHARAVLKQEFTGIDAVIDEVIDSITPWYLFPELQVRPTIINLWGMTGVGKSSLVTRIARLLEFEKQYFRFDLGEAFDREYSIKKKLMNLFPHSSGKPLILAFDEFQHARTVDTRGKELDKGFLRVVWEIMDSGKFTINFFSSLQDDLPQFISVFRFALKNGVEVENGVVVKGSEFFKAIKTERGIRYNTYCDYYGAINSSGKEKAGEKMYFFDSYLIDQLYGIARNRFASEIELRDHLDTLNGPETIKFLQEIHENSIAHQYVDCTKAIVFVLGNLDEAYQMSGNFNPDISADEFHRQSNKINLSTVKEALRKRFRSEQIARLGNSHIIYPSLNQQSFRRIIAQELDKVATRASRVGINLTIDESVHELIYQEGVIPTQGVRPLFTTVQQLLGTRLGKIMCEKILLPEDSGISVNLRWQEPDMVTEFLSDNKVIRTISETIPLALGKLRKSKSDDFQAITAVHEAGHAVLTMALLKILPRAVYSVTADDNIGGFIYTGTDHKYIARNEISARLAVMLGGMAAEEVVFGKERITSGAMSDVQQATHFVNSMIMDCGMGDFIGDFQYLPQATSSQLPADKRHIDQAESMIRQAYELALAMLIQQKRWLVNLADYLSDNSFIETTGLQKIAAAYAEGVELESLSHQPRIRYYRAQLKQEVHMVNTKTSDLPLFTEAEQKLNISAA